MTGLQGKNVVVTGSGQGLGAAYAKGLAALGARIVTNDILADMAEEVAEAIRFTGGAAVAHCCDVSKWEDAQCLIETCLSSFGRIDGLVNNAGIFCMGRIDEADADSALELDLLWRANVAGTFNCTAHAVRHMKESGGGSIVNVTSGAQMGIAAMGAYGSTKGAVAAFTYAWAIELAESRIRVNAVSPMAFTSQSQQATRYHAQRGQTVRRAQEIAPDTNVPVVAYLLSDHANGINGQVVRKEDKQLALMSHPAIVVPTFTRDNWSLEDVAEAFESELVKQAVPLGVMGVQIAGTRPVSPQWADSSIARG